MHFTTHDSNLSCNKWGFCKLCAVDTDFRLDKITQKLRQTRALRHKISLPCCRESARTNFVSKTKILNSVLSATTWFVASQVCWFVGGKTHNNWFASQLVLLQHVFCSPFYRTLKTCETEDVLESSQTESLFNKKLQAKPIGIHLANSNSRRRRIF